MVYERQTFACFLSIMSKRYRSHGRLFLALRVIPGTSTKEPVGQIDLRKVAPGKCTAETPILLTRMWLVGSGRDTPLLFLATLTVDRC